VHVAYRVPRRLPQELAAGDADCISQAKNGVGGMEVMKQKVSSDEGRVASDEGKKGFPGFGCQVSGLKSVLKPEH
jgi:hypothetical protein